MTDLNELREKIDQIDNEIIALYIKRMNVVKEVSLYKIKNNIPVLDASREAKMLEKNLNKIDDEQLKKYYIDVLKGFLTASKAMQNDLLKEVK